MKIWLRTLGTYTNPSIFQAKIFDKNLHKPRFEYNTNKENPSAFYSWKQSVTQKTSFNLNIKDH